MESLPPSLTVATWTSRSSTSTSASVSICPLRTSPCWFTLRRTGIAFVKCAEGKREEKQQETEHQDIAQQGAGLDPHPLQERLLLCFRFFVFAAFALRFQTFFAALGPVGRALHQLAAHQCDHRLRGAIALARSQAYDAG